MEIKGNVDFCFILICFKSGKQMLYIFATLLFYFNLKIFCW